MVFNLCNEDIQSDKKYFSSYKSPNICIVPSASVCYPPSPKRAKQEIPNSPSSPQNIDVSFLDDLDVDEIIKCLNDSDDNAQNISQSDIVNNDISEKDCIKSSVTITSDNERNELKYSIQRDLLTSNIDNEEIQTNIENTHKNVNTNTCIEKDIKGSFTYYNENKCSKDKGNSEMFKISTIIEQPNNKTYNNTQTNTSSGTIESNHQKNESDTNTNTKEIAKEKIDNLLQKREQHLASSNITFTIKHKPFNGNRCNKDNISNKRMINIKENATPILGVEKAIDKLNTNGITENKGLHTHDCSQNVNNVKVQKDIDQKQAESPNNNKPVLDMIIDNNLGNQTLKILNKKYSMFSLIYSGKYSKIFKCKDSVGEQYTVKMLKKKYNGYRQERLLNKIRSDIPKENLLCVFLITGFWLNDNFCFLTDFYPKNLKNFLKESKNLHIDTIQELASQLLGAVTTLRNKYIVHTDISPTHILLDRSTRKLRVCGFDRAYYIESANLFPYKGTKCYRAPEVILGYSGGFSIDVWSSALVLHEMATGIQLFGGCPEDYVLYKQMCLFGDVPPEMLVRSCYGHKYTIGFCFQDKCFRHRNNSTVKVKNKIASTIHGAYYSHWAAGRDHEQISRDMKKIDQFIRLLDNMLIISPERRLPIEFAYTNPFIYKVFNN